MAEFLAIAGGMAAVVQLAGTARRFFKTLRRFSMNAGAAGAEVERFANQVRTFSNAIELAEQTLSIYCREHPKSPLVAFVDRSKILANIDSEARAVQTHLRAVHARVVNMKSRSILWASIKWSFNKSSILELNPEMESVKASLNLLIALTQLEATMAMWHDRTSMKSGSEESSNKLQREMRKLRRVIKNHLETMQDLRIQLNRIRSVERGASLDSLDLELAVEDPLTELGWSIYERGSIPTSPQTSRSSSGRDYPNPPRKSHNASRIFRGPNTPYPVRSALPSRQVSPEPPDPPPSTGQALSSKGFPEPPPVNRTLRYRQENVGESTSGYVTNLSSVLHWQHTTASLVESLDGNIISIRKARELNLEIEAPSLAADVLFDFGTGLEKSFGKTSFLWKAWDYTNPQYPPLTITCDVCENSTVGLILGKPFLEERERHWPREETTGP
ncbi:hypothetical protein B0I37DRAFT_117004 [Chaetomium sp. MPI-CAGE-AT-0009]|nr:hypothetical protein B0I37DRAFT_117004 [Chaetomium sp. MPI-CAGE-AT-0009]